ncbi:MAG: hypothetical protein A2359_03860 [Candidatus Moranbacteria bacterium RIFOXYB1_FULL_43_19]|nr:MAG: hypothetical protein A2359_03860 [Candidatus Moranbacteria bacterium RIFOXYB1_FULL_43_19]OGI33999.1 MAG: hypothetical protein A2420_02550 [Candidatus Moranbacteria bacterium RIFOXYC1_FULL_44_13]OGI37712.1 MAG: hypothetical protein A2612_03045 [Candidatus Moranbacteria bacterium RIFOXYD1_FULL_44_12]
MPILLSISGPDGSGKSTQIELLKNCLRSQGKSFYYFHAVEFSIGNLCQKPKVKSQNIGSVTKANWLKIQLRKLALMIDTCRFNRLLKKLKVDYIISDRYFYDTVVNINYLEAELPSKIFAEKFIPWPDFAFYLKVDPEKIMRRERKPDQGLEYLAAKEKIYAQRIEDWDMMVLDGEKDKEEIFESIISKIKD